MRTVRTVLLVSVWMAMIPALAHAQATVAGVVKDSTGAVLPGVSVEAASPVLIEKVRTATTDSRGQYQIVDLRPGTYAITFTLPGFSTYKRDGVDISGAGVITVDGDMRVGAVSEEITVTGDASIVDIQSSRRQAVLDTETVNTLPASRGYGNLLATITGIQVTTLPSTVVSAVWYTAHGGRGNEGRIQLGGLNVGGAVAGGGSTGFTYDTVNSQEVQFTISGGLGEIDIGGPVMNIIPREGGNTFRGSVFISQAGKWAQSSNLDDDLRRAGITEPNALITSYDNSASIGGPIKRDRLWFYFNARTHGSMNDVRNLYANANAGDPTKWTYVEDRSIKGRAASSKRIGAVRLTSALTPRNKLGFYYDYQYNCFGSSLFTNEGGCREREDDWVALGNVGGGFGFPTSPEAANVWTDPEKIVQATWSSPVNSKLLLEAGYSVFLSRFAGNAPKGAITDLIAVTEQFGSPATGGAPVGNWTYRALNNRTIADQEPHVWRASATYVTGSHNMKFGLQGTYNITENITHVGDTRLSYRFGNGIPNQLTMWLADNVNSSRSVAHAIYAQDQWTLNRVTLQGALRYEHARSWFPNDGNGVPAGRFNPAISFGDLQGVRGYNDITPRMGLAWDVFGRGKTSLKVNIGKYLQAVTNEGTYTAGNKAALGQLQTSTSRAWVDADADYVPDCDLMNPAAQGNPTATFGGGGPDFCGGWANLNFGNTVNLTEVNPAVLEGWGKRSWDWQFGASVQQEILPRMSVEAGYHRRWFGNFYVTDNQAVSPQDFDLVTLTGPQHPNLPGGGGNPVSFYTIKPDKFGQSRDYFTFESDFGETTRYWHGVDVDFKARMQNGLVLQFGTSTGRGVRDTCDVISKLPERLIVFGTTSLASSCDITEPWLTQVRGLATYTIPKVDVLLSAVIRMLPNAAVAAFSTTVATNGSALMANYIIPNSVIQGVLGRPLAGGAFNTTVNILDPGVLYPEERLNTIDLRFAKVFRFYGRRADVGIDLYNLFNSNTVTSFDQTFGATWLRPTGVQSPRFARFNVTFDF